MFEAAFCMVLPYGSTIYNRVLNFGVRALKASSLVVAPHLRRYTIVQEYRVWCLLSALDGNQSVWLFVLGGGREARQR